MDRKRLFHTLALLITFIFLVNALANKFYWYSSIWYLDIIMHFLGGIWVGILALYFLAPTRATFRLILKILGVVLLVGLGWEVFEALVDTTVSKNGFNILDTSSDIFFDAVGGVVAIFYYIKNIVRITPNKIQ